MPSLDHGLAQSLGLSDPSILHDRALIGGNWVAARSGKTFKVEDPSTRQVLGEAPEMGAEDTDLAIAAAVEAFASFRTTTGRVRARMLRSLNDLLLAHKEDIAKVIVAENGKPYAEGLAEVDYAASFLEWFSGEAERSYGKTIPAANAANRIMTIKQPIGVVAALCPWNLPLAMATRKVGAALAAGCTTVLKPAGETPYSTLILGELVHRAKIPKGVINVVTTLALTAEVGEKCCTDPRVKKVSFTGSTRVGKLLARQSASTLKKLSLELGGNAPFVVFDDADLAKAVQGIVIAKLRNGGQTCIAANRILVQRGIVDKLVATLSDTVGKMVVGGGSEKGAQIGPLMSERAVDKVKEHVDQAVSNGAKVAWRYPTPLTAPQFAKGHFYPPTILVGLNDKMRTWEEEVFGPVAALTVFDTDEEALALANRTDVGLGAYVYSESLSRAMRAAEEIATGMVGINTGMLSACESPFGGVNESGYGKEGSYLGLDEYLVTKAITMSLG